MTHRVIARRNQPINRSLDAREWRLRRASHRDGASSRRRPGGALAREARETNDGRRSVRRRASYDETLAREIVNECAATARARASSEDALGAVREAVRGATKRANAR